MISIETLRKIDPEARHLSDNELEEIRKSFYDFGQLIFEDWKEQKFGSKYPDRSFPSPKDKPKLKLWKTPPSKQE